MFISYGRSLTWSRDVAYGLRDNLKARGVEYFLDVDGLTPGVNWRRELHRRSAEATVIVAVVEGGTVRRQWAGAELVTALRDRHYTGLPEIVVLAHPDIAAGPPPGALPVYRALLAGAADGELGSQRPRVVAVGDIAQTLDVVTDGLARGNPEPPAVVPPGVAAVGRVLLLVPLVLGVFCELFGLPALVFGPLEASGRYRLSEPLAG